MKYCKDASQHLVGGGREPAAQRHSVVGPCSHHKGGWPVLSLDSMTFPSLWDLSSQGPSWWRKLDSESRGQHAAFPHRPKLLYRSARSERLGRCSLRSVSFLDRTREVPICCNGAFFMETQLKDAFMENTVLELCNTNILFVLPFIKWDFKATLCHIVDEKGLCSEREFRY